MFDPISEMTPVQKSRAISLAARGWVRQEVQQSRSLFLVINGPGFL